MYLESGTSYIKVSMFTLIRDLSRRFEVIVEIGKVWLLENIQEIKDFRRNKKEILYSVVMDGLLRPSELFIVYIGNCITNHVRAFYNRRRQ